MDSINIKKLLALLGNKHTDISMELFLHNLKVKRRPYLDDEDIQEGRYTQWMPIRKIGLELGFISEAIFLNCDEDSVPQVPMRLTSLIFYGEHEGVKKYPYNLPYALSFDDSPQEVFDKMQIHQGSYRSYIRDVWEFDTHILTVTYDENRARVTDIIYMLKPKYKNTQKTPIEIEKLSMLFGRDQGDQGLKEALKFMNLHDYLGEQNQTNPHELVKEYGVSLLFADSEFFEGLDDNARILCEIALYDKCYLNFSKGYAGDLPFGLCFDDSQYGIVEKIHHKPVEIFENSTSMEGSIMWEFPSLSLKVVYSLLTNSIARVHIYPTWFFSVKDKEEWDIDEGTLIYKKLASILQKSAKMSHPIIRSGETAPKSGIYQAFLPPDHPDAQRVHANPASSRLCIEGMEMSPLGLEPEIEEEIRWEWVRE